MEASHPSSTSPGLPDAGAIHHVMQPLPDADIAPAVSHPAAEPEQTSHGLAESPQLAAASQEAPQGVCPQEQTVPEPAKESAGDAAVIVGQDAPVPLLQASASTEPFPQLLPEPHPDPAMAAWSASHAGFATTAPAEVNIVDDIRHYNTLEAQAELAEADLTNGGSHLVNEQRMSAYARLKFDDGYYYMHTYAIELGRDSERVRHEMKQKRERKRKRQHTAQHLEDHVNGNTENGSGRTNHKRKRDHGSNRPRSVISETGGIVRIPAQELPLEYQRRRASDASQSISSSSHHQSQGHSSGMQDQDGDKYVPHSVMIGTLPEIPVDLQEHVPDPNSCPLVPIHPSPNNGPSVWGGGKGISRRHAKISYNFDSGSFDLSVFGQNGLFLNNQICKRSDTIPLEHDDYIQIGSVTFKFQLPSSTLTDDDVCSNSMEGRSSRGMSFAFENGQGGYDNIDMSSEEDENESVNPMEILYRAGYRSDDSDDEDEEQEEDDIESDDDDETHDDEPPRKRMKKHPKKQTLKLKMKPPQKPVSKQQAKKKGKTRRPPPSPSPPPPPPKAVAKKQQKPKSKEPMKEAPKDKVTPPTRDSEKPNETNGDASKASEKDPQAKPEPMEQSNDPLSAGTILTAEICAKYVLPEAMIGQAWKPRKGPGRPPKDGFMSKREKAQLTRQAKEYEKAKKLGIDPKEYEQQLAKAKAGRVQKEGTSGDNEDVKESIEGQSKTGASDPGNEKKSAKSAKPPRSPSPVMKEEDYTEEQLQRPQVNYVVMIHEAITGSKTGSLNLQQIYSAIERKYPFYKFRVPTNGWQSSVRHNLGQHDAFKKGEKEGKGYNWIIDPAVSIEKERRKRATPPPQTQPQAPYYNPQQHPQGVPQPYYPGYPPYPTPHGVSVDASARNGTPISKDAQPSVPRLPPSLTRSNVPTNVPTAQGASTYASPWGGGGDAAPRPGSTPTTHGGHPYPPTTQGGHAYSPYGPPRQPAPPTTQGGQYGMLVTNPSNAQGHAPVSPYQQPYPAISHPQAHSDAQRPFSPYATAGLPQASPYSRPQPSEPQSQSRYPPHITAAAASMLEAFRNTFVQQSTEDKAFAERKVDNAIKHIVSPATVPALTDPELELVKVIKKMLPQTPPQVPTSTPGDANGQGEQKEQGEGPPSARTLSELATSAATIAASDAAAAVAANSKPAVLDSTTTGSQLNTPPASNRSDDTKARPKTPPMEEAVVSTNTDAARSGSSYAKTRRPSVEPLTPVPGSPMVVNQRPSSSAEIKRAFRQVSKEEEASDTAIEQASTNKPTAV